jgi:Kef-type K+ transport system membrane component KefB
MLALAAAVFLFAGGVARAPLLTALALSTTSIGLLLPVLRDGGLLTPPYGPAVLAAGALGEGAPLFLLPLALAHQGGAGAQAMIMIGFAVAAGGAIVFASHESRGAFAAIIERTMGTSGQLPMRLAICLLIFLVVLSQRFEIDLVLGAFVAGAVIRAALPKDLHEAMAARLDGIGSAFLVPVFFLSSGMRLDLAALNGPATAGMIAIYAMLMLLTRGAPALLLYDRELSPRQTSALALHSGTQLSLVVAIAGIAARRGLMPTGEAASLVAGAVVTVLLFPALATRILRETAEEEAKQPDLPDSKPLSEGQCAIESTAVAAVTVAERRPPRFWERAR